MKIYCLNYNSLLDEVESELEKRGQLTDNWHEADAFLIWQDVRGDCKYLAELAKNSLGKPVFVIQHGRGATRDYAPPNNFKLLADKIFVWGDAEKERLFKNGVSADRIEVVGCPLFSRLKPRIKNRTGKNILLAPVISSKEEPENLLVYAALKKWECDGLIRSIQDKFKKMKGGWATQEDFVKEHTNPDGTKQHKLWKREVVPRIARSITYEPGLLNVKLTGIHDIAQYMSPQIVTNPAEPGHIETTIELLRNTDVLVCLEEGTMQLLAHAIGVPVILVDIFQYGDYGGTKDYDRVEKIQTKACYVTRRIEKIGSLVDHVLNNPDELKRHRMAVCENEAGGDKALNATSNIIGAIEKFVSERTQEPVAA